MGRFGRTLPHLFSSTRFAGRSGFFWGEYRVYRVLSTEYRVTEYWVLGTEYGVDCYVPLAASRLSLPAEIDIALQIAFGEGDHGDAGLRIIDAPDADA